MIGGLAGQFDILRMIVITVPFLWTMFKVPEVAHLIFGGVGGTAQGFMNAVEGLAVRAIAAALL